MFQQTRQGSVCECDAVQESWRVSGLPETSGTYRNNQTKQRFTPIFWRQAVQQLWRNISSIDPKLDPSTCSGLCYWQKFEICRMFCLRKHQGVSCWRFLHLWQVDQRHHRHHYQISKNHQPHHHQQSKNHQPKFALTTRTNWMAMAKVAQHVKASV